MRIFFLTVLCVLIFLAGSSGLTKVMLMPQDVMFFGKYGVSNTLLMAFGALQVIGAAMMILPKTRLMGAVLVAMTFAISAVLLVMEGAFGFTLVTLLALVGLAWVALKSRAEQI